mgnify:CR=1 FL=1
MVASNKDNNVGMEGERGKQHRQQKEGRWGQEDRQWRGEKYTSEPKRCTGRVLKHYEKSSVYKNKQWKDPSMLQGRDKHKTHKKVGNLPHKKQANQSDNEANQC